ncbi:MAG TPA: adenylate/guanylate cyclase domain-containing protein [Geminicoccaceae bacterium]|nr:adenylate/guanylate cyclase domain-containing protein [Geminicoccus sp.]HMU50715.1 adenylate/guanylate cyclase domain-containing protein [Geminicoccaceae bacterium]
MRDQAAEAGPRILVAEDDPDIRDILVLTLAREGHRNVVAVADGVEAMDALSKGAFDLLLLDVLMPRLSGIEVLQRLRRMPGGEDVPVVVVSALSDLDVVVSCIRAGADDHLAKPFDPILLGARVKACLDRKRLRDLEKMHLAAIERERRRADDLLHALMPAPAVQELKETARVRPRRHEEVTLLIADVVDFTAFCDSRPATRVVRNLEDLVEWFEALAEVHGLEAIKTVGDAFFATGNLMLPCVDAPLAAARCALAMRDAAALLPEPWQIRAALHVGPVVSGVVGRSKPAFDFWGDTVNVTARLVGLGLPPGVYCTAAAWAGIEGRATGIRLEDMAVKGKGPMEVWRLMSVA